MSPTPTPPADPRQRPERDLPAREVPDERDPQAPNDKSDAEIANIERRTARRERSDVNEAGTPSK